MPTHARPLKYGKWSETTRVYDLPDGDTFPSVTSVIGMMDKPALVNWAANLAAQYSQDNREALIQLEPKAAVDAIKGSWRRSRDRAASFGTAVHEMIESGRIPKEDHPTYPYVAAAQSWMDSFGLRTTGLEVTVVSLEHGYAGTMDVLGASDAYPSVVADWKSGNGLYDSAALQLTALMNADHILTEDGELVKFDGADLGVAIRLTKHQKYHTEFIEKNTDLADRTFNAFLGLIPVWHYKTEAEVWRR